MRSGILRFAGDIAGLLATPLVPGDYLQYLNPLWSSREVRGRVESVTPLTDDSALLCITPGRGFDFDYKPGQFVGIGVLVNGRRRWRSYSILPPAPGAGPRDRGRHIAIGVKAKPGGFVSDHLVSTIVPGAIVRLALPAGDFYLPDPAPRRVLLLSAGSGITPVLALLRDLVSRGDPLDVVHIHSAPTRESAMFAGELEALRQDDSGYRLHLQETARAGRFDLRSLGLVSDDWAERDSFACGPAGFVEAAERHWQLYGAGDRLRIERFELQRTSTGNGGRITFGKSGRSTVADGATTLLEAADRAGVALPSGCRIGICRTCVLTLDRGSAVDIRTGELHETGARVQTCVCAPADDCELRM